MSILEELYNGNICPDEKYIKSGGEYERLMRRLADRIDELKPLLGEKGRELFEEIGELECSMERISDRESFIDGFCIGARLMMEILSQARTNRTVL